MGKIVIKLKVFEYKENFFYYLFFLAIYQIMPFFAFKLYF